MLSFPTFWVSEEIIRSFGERTLENKLIEILEHMFYLQDIAKRNPDPLICREEQSFISKIGERREILPTTSNLERGT